MIRVGFILDLNEGWLGGVNYFRNLLCAVMGNSCRNIQPVLFIPQNSNRDLLKDFPDVEIIESGIFTRGNLSWFIRRLEHKCFGIDHLLERLFQKHNIDIFSHAGEIPKNLKIPSLAWIPDFQHRNLPQFFTEREIKSRDRSFRELARRCTTLILSSYDAKKDLMNFMPEYADKARVLQFIVQPPQSDENIAIEELEKKYGFSGKFIYVPNQYWAHKNHKVILEALNILRKQNRRVVVISSGGTDDYRNPLHFGFLEQYINENNLSDMYHVLGRIPYSHVVTLEKNCHALINPSLFEGWSTTVEEAKSLGKPIVLSDIPIHREQNPPGATYFHPDNASELAEVLCNAWQSSEDDLELQKVALATLNKRCMAFAMEYEKIVIDGIRL